jgi:hypothetical protein
METEAVGTDTPRRVEDEHIEQPGDSEREADEIHVRRLLRWDAITALREADMAEDADALEVGR